MKDVAVYAFEVLFVFCVVYAMITDYSRLRIPNMISVVLALAFFPFAIIAGPQAVPLLPHLGLAALVFGVLFLCFAFGWMGGGDVKLAGAVMLWMGPSQGADFVVLFAMLGGALALGLWSLRNALVHLPLIEDVPVLGRFSGWARNNVCPYALPIGVAALLVAPELFARVLTSG
jgi:prepilin peptidase CpaA